MFNSVTEKKNWYDSSSFHTVSETKPLNLNWKGFVEEGILNEHTEQEPTRSNFESTVQMSFVGEFSYMNHGAIFSLLSVKYSCIFFLRKSHEVLFPQLKKLLGYQ